VWELFRQLAASGEFGFYCLLFPNTIHNCMTAGQGEGSKKPLLISNWGQLRT
jgi:hypothetical protein